MSRDTKTPFFSIYLNRLERNLKILKKIEDRTDVKILHTLKSFNNKEVLPILAKSLSGFSVSSINEFSKAKEILNNLKESKDIHLYAPAYKEDELIKMVNSVDTISFNSINQYKYFKKIAKGCSLGLRVNPKLNLDIPSYCNSSLSTSHLGVDYKEFLKYYSSGELKSLKGLHFHTLFRASAKELRYLFTHIEESYKDILPNLMWLNLGGGHSFTSEDYNFTEFEEIIDNFRSKYSNIKIYFEPGEAVICNCGEFTATVLDIVDISNIKVAILDTSIEAHMLDVAITKVSPKVKDTQDEPTKYRYQLTGNSCLQGDIIGNYYFKKRLNIGDIVTFTDMLGYTLVKQTEFNGLEKAKLIICN